MSSTRPPEPPSGPPSGPPTGPPTLDPAIDQQQQQLNYLLLAITELRHAVHCFQQAGKHNAAAEFMELVQDFSAIPGGDPENYYAAQDATAGYQSVSRNEDVLVANAEANIMGALKILQELTPEGQRDEEVNRRLRRAYNAYLGEKMGAPKTGELGYRL